MKTPEQKVKEARNKVVGKIRTLMQVTSLNCDQRIAEHRKRGSDMSPDEFDRIYDQGAEEIYRAVSEFKTINN